MAFTVADALLKAILMATRCVSMLRIFSWVFDVLFNMLCSPRYFNARAAFLVDTCSSTVWGVQSPLCTCNVGLAPTSTDKYTKYVESLKRLLIIAFKCVKFLYEAGVVYTSTTIE